ncbi:MAG: hypothetical protein LBV38_02915 [Alistipes sp.]|nr:hypothetical protein [Alistipes sp.]
MKKLAIITLLVTFSVTLRAQTTQDLTQTDNAITTLATELTKKFAESNVQTVTLGQYTFMGGATQFNAYLNNQLSGELTSTRGGTFSLVSGGNSQWIVSGEIVRIADIIRIYTRLVRRENSAVASQIRTDLTLNPTLSSMLTSGDGNSGGGSTASYDALEPDGWDNPSLYTPEAESSATTIGRSIGSGDEDWFLITPASASVLVMETTGSMDTHMTLYDADTRNELASNDDGSGNGNNARITQFVRPGKRYMVKVKGYSSDTTGDYGFRAYTVNLGDPTRYEVGEDVNASRVVRQRLEGGTSVFLLTAPAGGTIVAETSGSTDVVMELLDAETYDQLASDDDSGYDSNARITHEAQRGKSYLAVVRAYSSDTNGEFGFKSYMD